jgi:hypothetical protein
MTTYSVVRTDDHGNRIVVREKLDRSDAEALAATMTARGHKQTYEVMRDEEAANSIIRKLIGP